LAFSSGVHVLLFLLMLLVYLIFQILCPTSCEQFNFRGSSEIKVTLYDGFTSINVKLKSKKLDSIN